MSREILPWRKIESHKIADCKVFSLERNRALMPTGEANRAFDFYVLHPSHWCNVIPITDDGRVVFIEQYRHGIEKITLEIPGGAVDPEDPSSQYAAARELFEETGYVSDELTFIGRNHPNPALQSNFCDTFLARGVKQICEPTFQGAEDIKIKLVEMEEVPHLIASGAITHALVLVAFYFKQIHDLKIGTPSQL